MARHTRTAVPVLVALACALGGCTSPGDGIAEGPTATATATAPAAVPDDARETEKRAVLGVLGSMWSEQMKAYHRREVKGTRLEKYASLDALGEVRVTITRMKQAGTELRGDPRYDGAVVSALDLAAKIPKATITACSDLSGYRMTKAGAPVPLPSNQPLRYRMTVSAEKWPDGWMIIRIDREGNRSC